MPTDWVDFKTVKQAVTMEMVLGHYGIKLRKSGPELRGRCPIHQGEGSDTFHVDVERSIFNCFSGACKAKGNVLDNLGRWTESKEAYRRSIELDPNFATAHQWYARALSQEGYLD